MGTAGIGDCQEVKLPLLVSKTLEASHLSMLFLLVLFPSTSLGFWFWLWVFFKYMLQFEVSVHILHDAFTTTVVA